MNYKLDMHVYFYIFGLIKKKKKNFIFYNFRINIKKETKTRHTHKLFL